MGSSFKTEIMAGIVSFAAISYIMTLNPQAMQGFASNQRTSALLVATIIGAILGTLIVALYAKLPFVQAPGMGLNTLVGSILAGGASSLLFENIMAIIFVSGLVFILLSTLPVGRDPDGKLIRIREKIFDSIPKELTTAIGTGIGLFIAFVGLKNAGVITSDFGTLVTLVDFSSYTPEVVGSITCLIGLVLIVVLSHFKVTGSVLIGIVASTIIAGLLSIPLGDKGLLNYDMLAGNGGVSWKFWESFSSFFSFDKDSGAFGLFVKGFSFPAGSFVEIIGLIIAFSMVNIFDTIGSVMALGQITKDSGVGSLIGPDGKPVRYNRALLSDASSTVAGAMIGTSNVVIYIESGAGIVQGGRTGFTGVVAAFLFVLSLFVLPIFAFIPTAAVASVLVYVGVLMVGHVADINFKDIRCAAPAFVTIIAMPLSYSIVNGIGLGVITFVLVSSLCWIVEKCKGDTATATSSDNITLEQNTENQDFVNQDFISEDIQNKTETTLDQKTKFPSITAIIISLAFVLYFVLG